MTINAQREKPLMQELAQASKGEAIQAERNAEIRSFSLDELRQVPGGPTIENNTR